MNAEPTPDGEELFDAVLSAVDAKDRLVTFTTREGGSHRLQCPKLFHWSIGTIGRLRLPSKQFPFAFYPYPDQRLRRVPAEDDPQKRLWGWRIGAQPFAAKAGVIPGKRGEVIGEDTEALVLQIPREFIDRCARYRLHPQTVLCGFIADLCELISWVNCPREDGYSSNGSDERLMAQQYFDRVYGWLPTTGESD
jgi:hypothetical protein